MDSWSPSPAGQHITSPIASRENPELRETQAASRADAQTAWQHCLNVAVVRRQNRGVPCRPSIAADVPVSATQARQGLAQDLLDLYAPLLSLTPAQPFAIGHLAQGVDGNIATDDGSSRGLSGEQNHQHLHRLRALADAVIVGASTALLDDPLLTVRLVSGPNPARLVIDPSVRLPTRLRMFNDDAAPAFIVCALSNRAGALARWGSERVIGIDTRAGLLDLKQLQQELIERGWPVVLAEGGGVTVSRMLEAGFLQRVHISISPVLVGGSRRGLQLASPAVIDDCARPPVRVFRMGEDFLWDIDLGPQTPDGHYGTEAKLTKML